ncbi:DUF3298 and DUF4163 domain-containing protein [Clostridium saccharoperbutylacetonicum]|uniref:DUF3298 and DUF4163 domain-containing protein n=1 Tax=Clostridium saccharoperbutylacetonicum TaxID=36745 RepID=UPI000983A1F3|nr:DUF3298 and DUF4163 domain-containing protein [Clostridium saccharoperbutylacetonicum]AQR93059.1 anti-sigma-V factor RsiV [Clostridium saccharoperbutylacetonicum]NSB34470.1 hypothetical protein [Clostridium saccharoperbutylacetonicum]
MGILTNIVGIIVVSSMLYTAYPQNLCISCVINGQSEIKLVEKSIEKNSDYLKEDIKIPQFIGGNDEKRVNIINNTINDDILPKINDAEKTAKEYFGKIGQEKPTFPYEIFSRYTVSEDNNKVLSLFNDYYEYLGGAHGMTIRSSYTIDKSTENLLFLKDLFAPGYNYMDIINKEIKREIKENPQNYFDSGNVFKGIKENQNFYIQDGELVIYYQLYELAPYVFGFPEFKIPLKVFDSNYIYT